MSDQYGYGSFDPNQPQRDRSDQHDPYAQGGEDDLYSQAAHGQPQPYSNLEFQQAATTAFNDNFFVSYLGAEHGPVTYAQLQAMAATGQLKPETLVRSASGGYPFQAKQVPGVFSEREWVMALILALFLGAIGVDRFYLGYTGLGIAKLVVCLVTCGIGGVIWQVVDVILLATRKLPDVDGRQLS